MRIEWTALESLLDVLPAIASDKVNIVSYAIRQCRYQHPCILVETLASQPPLELGQQHDVSIYPLVYVQPSAKTRSDDYHFLSKLPENFNFNGMFPVIKGFTKIFLFLYTQQLISAGLQSMRVIIGNRGFDSINNKILFDIDQALHETIRVVVGWGLPWCGSWSRILVEHDNRVDNPSYLVDKHRYPLQ